MLHRREFFSAAGLTSLAALSPPLRHAHAENPGAARSDLIITDVTVTPIALPDPPILAASGCHGPYFLRNVIELRTADGIVGIGETTGGQDRTDELRAARDLIRGKSAFAWRAFAAPLLKLGTRTYAGIELACLDAIGRATGLPLSKLLGGPLHDAVEFAAYLFFRYAADDPRVLDDARIVDSRGKGDAALDRWGEVRTPDAMADLAEKWHRQFGFRHHKLKAGVLEPDIELAALRAINERFDGKHLLRIDPNGRWRRATAIRIGHELKSLPLEYYEDPVRGQSRMAAVRDATGLPMSTNMCVTSFDHIPEAVETEPIDVVLADHHYWGGLPACQALGTIAAALGWTLSQHSNNHAGITMAAMTHLASVVPQLTCPSDTHYPWLPQGADIIAGPNTPISNGRIKVPTTPGVGVTLDRDKLARAHETYEKCGMRERDDERTMRRIEPGWTSLPL